MINRIPLSLAVLCADCDTIWNVAEWNSCPACASDTFAPVDRLEKSAPGRYKNMCPICGRPEPVSGYGD